MLINLDYILLDIVKWV